MFDHVGRMPVCYLPHPERNAINLRSLQTSKTLTCMKLSALGPDPMGTSKSKVPAYTPKYDISGSESKEASPSLRTLRKIWFGFKLDLECKHDSYIRNVL